MLFYVPCTHFWCENREIELTSVIIQNERTSSSEMARGFLSKTCQRWPFNYRFCSLDLFSFSLNPEILSCLWRSSQTVGCEPPPKCYHPAQLLQIALSSEPEDASLLSTVHHAVVISGILVVVGLSSYCSYKLLQCVRQDLCASLLQKLRHFIVKPFVLSWRHPAKKADDFDSLGHVIKNNNLNGRLHKRPSDLQLVSSGSPVANLRHQKSRDNSLERRLLEKVQTPLADCDIATGEEDISDIQGQYFGPTTKSATHCMELMGSSPDDTPEHTTSADQRRRRGRDHDAFY